MIELSFKQISESLEHFKFPDVDVVVGIGMGGIVPACLVAHQLKRDLQTMVINHRDGGNQIAHPQPIVISKPHLGMPTGTRILLVDDVSVTGKTFAVAREMFQGNKIITFALKGKADLVLFPMVSQCVSWPWKA